MRKTYNSQLACDDNKLMFWLNPEDQRNNHFGWYTVEDLDMWIENSDRIPASSFQRVNFNREENRFERSESY